MDHAFWHERWESQNTPFHESAANPLLVQYFTELALPPGARVFVPLCGKTLDIHWLLEHGYRVAGAELSQLAIEQLFAQLGLSPQIAPVGESLHYSAPNIDIFVGDIFQISQERLGPVDGIWDRAALVALPKEMRERYAAHLMQITETAPQLLVSYEYDQSVMPGPPFSVTAAEIEQHYAAHYRITQCAALEVPNGLKGKCPATERVWLLASSAD